jgi:hypothetical protein
MRTGWSAPGAAFVNNIPAGSNRDISAFEFFQFRTTLNFTDTRNPSGQSRDFSIRFTDGSGASQALRVGQFSRALFFPPGTNGAVPKVWHNTVRIPLSSLTAVDKTNISRVELLFDQSASGALLVSDLHFYNSGGAAPPQPTTIFFDDFETSQGWTTNAGGTDTATTGLWERETPSNRFGGPKQLGTTVSGVNGLVTGATTDARRASMTLWRLTSIQSPQIVLTGGGSFRCLSSTIWRMAQFFRCRFLSVKIVAGSTTAGV